MEAEAFRQQQEAIAKSLETQEAAAQIADAACLGSPLVTLLMGEHPRRPRPSEHLAGRVRRGRPDTRRTSPRIQAEAARDGSALMQRNRPGSP